MRGVLGVSAAVLGVAVLVGWEPAVAQNAAPQRKPNVVLIVADDLGHADVGAQGQGGDLKTPNIDSIATSGVRFTNGYVSCPVCAPTRAGLMTGRYQQRFGFEQNHTAESRLTYRMPADQVMLPEQLKKVGYATGMVGKWHLGEQDEASPTKRGFDEFFGFRGGAHGYFNNNKPAVKDPNAIRRGDEPVGETEYLTDAFSREAVAFVERHKGEPFFLYLAYNAPHSPMQVTEKYLSRFPNVEDGMRRRMLAMMSAVDDGVGQVLSKLREHKLEENTLVVFLSDNGGPVNNGTDNTPYRGRKGFSLEGGIHVPFLMQWKGKLPAGKVEERMVIQLDLFPTILGIAGGQVPTDRKMDGVDLMPFLVAGKQGPIHEALYWRFGPRRAIRSGDWKLQWHNDETPHLYNLADDTWELKDRANDHPEIAQRLMSQYKGWDTELAQPGWPGKLEGPDSEYEAWTSRTPPIPPGRPAQSKRQ